MGKVRKANENVTSRLYEFSFVSNFPKLVAQVKSSTPTGSGIRNTRMKKRGEQRANIA